MERIVLNLEDFKALIGGEIVRKHGTDIILSDIGYRAMLDEIMNNINNNINN